MDEPKNDIEIITEIGTRGYCTIEELHHFLPNFPSLRGSEMIISNIYKYTSNRHQVSIINIIKGLHLIELKYREVSKNEFGFGSPSKTNQLILDLIVKEGDKGIELYNWVAFNGGNYYIDKNISYEQETKIKK